MAACAETASFQPTENVVATSHGSQPAASYEIQTSPDESEQQVKVDVWSEGAKASNNQTIVEATLSVSNLGDNPVTVDWRKLRLEAYDGKGRPLPQGQLVAVSNPTNTTVMPKDARDVKVRFALPGDISPDAIGGLRLRWGVLHGEGQEYVQFTSFQRVPEYYWYGYDSFYNPLWGYYDPLWYGGPVGTVVVR
ncbi:MAG: hypothetical protein HOV81_24645 [Kofleriaceae bacterium]|nr:hypothetical protein [Kofleriaceae bacterium]